MELDFKANGKYNKKQCSGELESKNIQFYEFDIIIIFSKNSASNMIYCPIRLSRKKYNFYRNKITIYFKRTV